MSYTRLQEAPLRHGLINQLVKKCFEDSYFEVYLNLREYMEDNEYIIFDGVTITPNSQNIAWVQIESCTVPKKYLIEFIQLNEAEANTIAWLRLWSNMCDEFNDFKIGLPGESNVFDSELKQSTWEKVSQGEAFADMEGRLFAYKLLRGESQ